MKEDKIKIKPLTKSQILIAFDRLTRFKPTEEKYLRVFSDVILSNLIYPKFKKDELNSMPYDKLSLLAEKIFNDSINLLGAKGENDFIANKKLLAYEKRTFSFPKSVEKLVDNKINYSAFFDLIQDHCLCKNLKWLEGLLKSENQTDYRQKFSTEFPIEKILIVEGITEEILLPKFSKLSNQDFDKKGIHIISAGGKNQVVRQFYKYSESLKLPIFVILDKDGVENYEEIKPRLRKGDCVRVLECGEFEDLLPENLIKRTLNRYFDRYFSVKLDDLRKNIPMTKILEEIFKQRSLEFKKAEFAAMVEKNVEARDLSEGILNLINQITLIDIAVCH